MNTTINNAFQYAHANELMFTNAVAENGYEVKTTFYSDLSIAELFGAGELRKSFNSIVNNWQDDVVFFTEFVMCLNYKIWQHYKQNEQLAKVYDELWRKAEEIAENKFTGNDLEYYYRTLD